MRSLVAAALLAFPCAVFGAPSPLSKRGTQETTTNTETTPSSPPHVNLEVFDGQVNFESSSSTIELTFCIINKVCFTTVNW